MIWHAIRAVPAASPLLVLLLGCLLGIIAVVALRSARKTALLVSLLVLLIPLSAFAGVQFVFANGTIADALQINEDFAEVIPVVGRSQATAGISGTTTTFVFPSAASFVATHDLKCVVTIQPFVDAASGAQVTWNPAMQIGSTQTVGPSAGPGPLSLVLMPVSIGLDHNYIGTFTEVFTVPNGSVVSFGARFSSLTSGTYQPTVTAVYSCSIPP